MLRSGLVFVALCYLFAFSGCGPDEPDLRAEFIGKEFGVLIFSPAYDQGFSIKETIEFRAIANFLLSGDASLLNHLVITFHSDKDGLLDGELINQDGNIIFRPKALSSGEHTITIKAVDPNQIEKSSWIEINNLAPGTVTLTVSKDPRENAIVNWSVPSPELVDVIELYRTQYTYIDGGLSYNPEPWDTIRLNPADGQSFYDNELPFADKVTYSIKVFTKDGYWSKNERDTTIDGTKRFKLNVRGDHDWNVYGADAISLGSQKIIHIRNGSNVTAFDFEKMSVARNLDMISPVNYFHMGDHGSGPELYVARGQTLQIYNSSNYEKKMDIDVEYEIEGIQGHDDLLFLSMSNHVNRTTLSKTANFFPFPSGYRFVLLEDGYSLIGISYATSPTDMKYIDFKNDLNNPDVIDDKYHNDHPLHPGLFEVIPQQDRVITSWFGSIYTADQNMDFVGSLGDVESEYFTCFAFNDSGTIIYAGSRDEKKISMYSFPEMNKLGEIKTKGHSAFLFFKGDYLVSVSSTKRFDWPSGPAEIGFEIFDL